MRLFGSISQASLSIYPCEVEFENNFKICQILADLLQKLSFLYYEYVKRQSRKLLQASGNFLYSR